MVFIGKMAEHLRANFAGNLASIPDEDLRRKITTAISIAAALGIERRADLARYLNLCVAAGWDFLQDPNHADLANALSADRGAHASARVDEACARLQHRLDLEEARAKAWEKFHALNRAKQRE